MIFFLIHAVLVVDGGLELHLFWRSFPGLSALKTYGRITALNLSYPFFGPAVQNEVFLTLRAQDGDTHILERTDAEWSMETRIRVNDGIRHLDLYRTDDALGKTFAADFFARHRCARNVDIALYTHTPPSMSGYRAGQGAHEPILYEAVFARRGKGSTCS